jgi:release factor glutamine methyltransferase
MSGSAALVTRLRAAGCVFAEDEARMLVEAAESDDHLERMVTSRIEGVPLESVLGWVDFCGLRLAVEPGVFVPRRRTELLVSTADERGLAGRTVVDLCCGTGAVGAALLAAEPTASVFATDIDPAAVHNARRNLPPGAVFEGDLFLGLPERLRGRVDLVAANAPYVPTGEIANLPREARLFEARAALDGGADGLDLHRRIAAVAPEWLAPGGWLIVESSRRQAPETAALFERAGLSARIIRSNKLDATAVVGVRRR